jgi:hypothetical protein
MIVGSGYGLPPSERVERMRREYRLVILENAPAADG